MNPLDGRKQQGSKRFSLAPLWGKMLLLLYTGTAEKYALSESDGKLTVSNYGKAGSTSTSFATETTGEQKMQLYGKATTTIAAIQTESAGELKTVNYGKDAGGTLDAFRTNDNLQ